MCSFLQITQVIWRRVKYTWAMLGNSANNSPPIGLLVMGGLLFVFSKIYIVKNTRAMPGNPASISIINY